MSRRAFAVAVLAALAVAGTAAAKGPDRARLCGKTTACRVISGDQQVYPLISGWETAPFSERGAPRPAPHFTIAIDSTQGEPGKWFLVWVPSKRLLRVTASGVPPYTSRTVGPYWRSVPAVAVTTFNAAVHGLVSHPAVRGWRLSR